MALIPTKPAAVQEGFHGMLYGDPKSGKTSTLDDPNMKILLLDLEGGSAVLQDAENVDRIAISSWEDLIEAGKSVRQGFIDLGNGEKFVIDHDLIAIDSISQVQEICKEYVALRYAPNRKREIIGKFGAQSDWGDLRQLLIGLVKGWHSITKQGEKSKHVLWLAHKGTNTDDMTSQVTSTKIQLQGKDTAEVLMSIVDGIFYMVKRQLEDGTIQYGILTNQKGIFTAGYRATKKSVPLPEFIVNPSWHDIFTKLGYTRK